MAGHQFLHHSLGEDQWTIWMISLNLSTFSLPTCRYQCHINLPPGCRYIDLRARQACICTYFWYLTTDFDMLGNLFHCFHNNSLDFNVYSLQNTYRLCLSSVAIDGSHKQLWVWWQPYKRYFQILCTKTPRQCPNFRLWTFFISVFWHLVSWNGFKVFGKSVKLSYSVYT